MSAAVIWAVSIAVYQQVMEPSGFFTDPTTGQPYPNLASNNTYWPREVRHMAILLAFAGVAVICRAGGRGLAAGAIGSVAWLGADLWLDRIDIDGRTAAWLLAVAGFVGFAATAGIAAWLTRGRPGTSRVRYLAAGTLSVLTALTLVISTPWDEPVVDPDRVRVEDALTALQVGLVVMFLLAMLALLAGSLTRANAWWVASFLAVMASGAALAIGSNGQAVQPGAVVVLVGGLLVVAAAREVPRARLFIVGLTGVVMLPVVLIVVVIGGMFAGQIMTSIAGNPEVNGADTDLTLGLPGLVVGLAAAAVALAITAGAGPDNTRAEVQA